MVTVNVAEQVLGPSQELVTVNVTDATPPQAEKADDRSARHRERNSHEQSDPRPDAEMDVERRRRVGAEQYDHANEAE